MKYPQVRRVAIAATAAAALTVGLLPAAGAVGAAAAAAPTPAPQVRVNQVGYPTHGPKIAYAMVARPGRVVFSVQRRGSHLSVNLPAGRNLGRWNANYHAVYALPFTAVHRPGSYRISVRAGGKTATSPWFTIASTRDLYPHLVDNAVRYYTSERDGGDVVRSVLDRRPANLTDRRATVYRQPRYDSDDNLLGTFHKVGGPVDVAGGWFDAGGGYEKFAYTSSYTDGILMLAQRASAGRYPSLGTEAAFGLRWLEKLWRPKQKVLYIQVGIGTGNASGTIHGDYDFWFLPQAEDRLGAKPGDPAYYVEYRPVFRAAPPGKRFSPDFAGRFGADFALGAQLAAGHHDRSRASHLLRLARGVYAMARTQHVKSIITAFPHDFYPGSQWKSDMLWGAAEIALADEAMHAPAATVRADLAVASRWARAYIAQGHPAGSDTLNLYDTGAVAESELLRALAHAHGGHAVHGGPGISRHALLADIAKQLRVGEGIAKGEPFGLGTGLGTSDVTPHAFGLFSTYALYRHDGGRDNFGAFAQRQLNFVLGANAWGSSFVVGAGTTFPHCMQSEIANLAGSLSGKGNIQLGATVDGPSDPGNFIGLGSVDGMRACRAGTYKPFNTKAAGYLDNVISWPSVEPAGDYTASSLLAFVLATQHH
ncbi:MAG TPA: glycoside hydrolase family 9 protein [Streptosporangiaceae bacterium]